MPLHVAMSSSAQQLDAACPEVQPPYRAGTVRVLRGDRATRLRRGAGLLGRGLKFRDVRREVPRP